MSIRILIVGLMLTAAVCGQAGAGKLITAEGSARIYGGDVAGASERAVRDALRRAVEQSLGIMIDAQTVVRHQQMISDRILARTSGYVRKYEVTARRRINQNTYGVTILAEVQRRKLRDDLAANGILYGQAGFPKLMIQPAGEKIPEFDFMLIANVLTERLNNRGFDVMNAGFAATNALRNGAIFQAAGSKRAIRNVALQKGADIAILLEGDVNNAGDVPQAMKSAGLSLLQARVTLSAVRADDGKVIATASADAQATHFDSFGGKNTAFSAAVEKAADQLSSKLLAAWRQEVYETQIVSVQIDGLQDYGDLLNLIPYFRRLASVQEVVERQYLMGSAAVEFRCRSNAAAVAVEVNAADFSPYRVKILARGSHTLTLRILQ